MGNIKKYCLLLILPTLLVGCSKSVDIDELKKNIDISNRRIESAIEDYNTSKYKATKFYNSAIEYISDTKNTLILDNIDTYYVDEFKSILDSFKEVLMTAYEDDKLLNEENGFDVKPLKDFISGISESYYFLNETNATLEQDILFKLPYGEILVFEIEWLGGGVYDFKTYTHN